MEMWPLSSRIDLLFYRRFFISILLILSYEQRISL
jgi:hypothetical protein